MINEELLKIGEVVYRKRIAHKPWKEKDAEILKLLRSIEIAALREALEVAKDNFVQGIDHAWITHIKPEAIAELERKIRELELK